MQNDKLICPNCNSDSTYINLDSYGRTPWHYHCAKCNINIGATSIEKCIELVGQYHNKNTWIEYYNNEIKVFKEGNKVIINAE